jgi:PDZ domain-containing protein
VVVTQTVPNFPAASVLRPGDVLTAVDGRPVTSLTATDVIDDRGTGQPVTVTVDRRGVPRTFRIVTKPGPGGQSAIGIYEAGSFTFPFTVRVNGSSCPDTGCDLILALALLDKLAPLNLTGGASVAGTGTIDDTGDIGPVFGINVLLAGLGGQGATVFLTPAADCAQALRAAPPGLRLVKVSTLGGAVRALEALRAGRPAPSCAA